MQVHGIRPRRSRTFWLGFRRKIKVPGHKTNVWAAFVGNRVKVSALGKSNANFIYMDRSRFLELYERR